MDNGPLSVESAPTPDNNYAPRATATIDLAAIESNVRRLLDAASGADVMAVVKADAYGHGLVPVARACREGGATWLGTALLSEALELRAAGDEGRLFAWLATPGDSFAECIQRDIDLSASALWMLTEIAAAAKRTGRTARVHLKVDTGLGRGGTTEADWPQLLASARRWQDEGSIEVVGVWSHFAYADEPGHPTIAQALETFRRSIELAQAADFSLEVRHIANSAATLSLPESHFDLVRPGIAIYGLSPGPAVGTPASLGLRPAMTLTGRLVHAKQLPTGHGVSYAHQYVMPRTGTVGLVPLGYADGIPRNATNRAPVWAAGRQRTISGRVCMDQFVIDLGDADAVAGDEVILFGPGDQGEPTADDWAAACDTINYEIVTRIGPRVERVFQGRGA